MSQICQIVNENDEIIGHKPRNEIDFKHDYYRISCLWLTNSTGQVLLAQRLITKDKDPGKWGPSAAGTLEKGETYESNIYKEAQEELGLTGIVFAGITKLKLEVPRKSFMQLYTGVCDWPVHQFRPQPEEVAQLAWITIDELAKDIDLNPDKYVPSMKIMFALLFT